MQGMWASAQCKEFPEYEATPCIFMRPLYETNV